MTEAKTYPPVLDACCGSRMFWFDKADKRAVYVDKRCEVITQDQPQINHHRVCKVDPDHVADFTDLPFPDDTFALVVFDPPHKTRISATSTFTKFYGALTGDWRDMLRKGFSECFRVLRPDGVLVFKWNDIDVCVDEILALTPEKPLFGHPTRRGALPRKGKPNIIGTHWIAFLKPNNSADSSEPAGSSTCNDGDLLSVAAHGLRCAISWEPGARIIGNCRAADLRKIFEEYIALKSPKTALTSDDKGGVSCSA